jgi:2-polyprenyl-3-methyl-5-hydroxy-6-metoxy-1,4-benzoquinol methylase
MMIDIYGTGMPKSGEKTYFAAIGAEHALNTLNKPFAGPDSGPLLSQIGAILSLLPNPPGKLLDLGCGTGWTSVMLAKRGYDVTGQDISEEAVSLANQYQLSPAYKLTFEASDYESMSYNEDFDCAVFFDSLHHAEDEVAALKSVYRALRPRGVVVISEPGKGHGNSAQARAAVEKYNVTERDMPPLLIVESARAAGFTSAQIFPDIGMIHKALYKSEFSNRHLKNLLSRMPLARILLANYLHLRKDSLQGIVVLQKS